MTFSAIRDRTPITEFSITVPRPMTEPSQIRLFLTVAPAIREQGRNRGRVKIGPASEAKSNGGWSLRQLDVGLVEGTDRSDVLPVAVEQVGLDAVIGDRCGRISWPKSVALLERSRSTRSVD